MKQHMLQGYNQRNPPLKIKAKFYGVTMAPESTNLQGETNRLLAVVKEWIISSKHNNSMSCSLYMRG
jgi:hypothetical protein